MDAAYAAGEQAAQATQPATRSRLLGSLYTSLLPAVDAELSSLEQLHAGDPPAERADLQLFIRQWTAVRNLLSLADLTAQPAGALAAQLTAAYQPVSAHLDRLILNGNGRREHRPPAGLGQLGPRHRPALRRRGPRHRDRCRVPVARDRPHPPEPGAQPGPGGVRGDPAARQRRGRDVPAPAALPRAHAAGHRGRGAQPEQQRGPAGGGHVPAARLAAGRDLARRGAALVPGGPVGPDAPRRRRAAGPPGLRALRRRSRGLVVRPAHGRGRSDRLGPAQPPSPLFGGGGAADPRVGRPGRAGAGQPAQPGRGRDPRRHRRPDRAAQPARGRRRAEADVRPGRSDPGAARAAHDRPRPLQADQRPARAPGGRPGPGRRRRGAARRAAEPGLRRPQGRGGVRDPAARHRGRRRAGDRRAGPRGDRGHLPPGQRRVGHGLGGRGRLPRPCQHPGPARAPRRRGSVRGQAAGP